MFDLGFRLARSSKEMYPEVQKGTIQVMCFPKDAKIELKYYAGKYYSATGSETFIDVPVGIYKLTVGADGYKTYSEDFRLIPGNTVVKQITMEEGRDIPEGMVFVEGGIFQMGSIDGEDDEKQVHSVSVSDFCIGRYEVTEEEYATMMGNSWVGDIAPVSLVSWYNAVEFCNKLSDKDGLQRCYSGSGENIKCDFNANGYRLPTEAEWEYAARGGNESKSFKYAGSNDIESVAWYYDNSGSEPHPAGYKQANELGIYDMSGNVSEWCNDWYGSYSYSVQTNPRGQNSGYLRVYRGGSWYRGTRYCSTANRDNDTPDSSYKFLGFRLARSSK
ncbi:MAG: SUMF1/EgtB/PvdO family nonheme iron enzyme [Candidatus Cloacimonetes bacterium]|nr:SUMF1/EgtB/PvdO family nonheme iron enzyme [Candidatus Cloacimonadota bacterium]